MNTNPGIEKGYALDFLSVVRHVATRLDEAPGGLSTGELAATYRGFPADLLRVRHHHGLRNDRAAVEFLMERAVAALGKQVTNNDGVLTLAKPFDELRYERRALVRDVESKLGDPFNPLKEGGFADNIRKNGRDDLSELSGSMQSFGWIDEFPAIQDERGVTLVGHRRLKVADQLGIEPKVKTISLGQGDEADAYRLRLAIASNLGSKPFTDADKKRIAEHLYGEGWNQARIGEAIMASQASVSRLLSDVNKSSRAERRGRPTKLTPDQLQFIAENYHEFGGTMSLTEVSRALGFATTRKGGSTTVVKAIDEERGRRQGEREAGERARLEAVRAQPEPDPDPEPEPCQGEGNFAPTVAPTPEPHCPTCSCWKSHDQGYGA